MPVNATDLVYGYKLSTIAGDALWGAKAKIVDGKPVVQYRETSLRGTIPSRNVLRTHITASWPDFVKFVKSSEYAQTTPLGNSILCGAVVYHYINKSGYMLITATMDYKKEV